jgi:phospholipid transport system substrate-binding protein
MFVLVFCLPSLTYGEQPIDALQQCIDEGIMILNDPQYRDNSQKGAQRQKLWEVTQQIFDHEEFSKRALGSKWKTFTTEQREEILDVFSEFLSKYYLNELIEKYSDEQVGHMRQRLLDDNKAEVIMKVEWRSARVPVKVKMLKRDETWKVYDVQIMGVSALLNYRAQFQVLLLRDTPEELIERLKKRVIRLEEDLQKEYARKSSKGAWF